MDDDITHVHGTVDPVSDIETINIELAFADLDTVQKRLSNIDKLIKSHDKKVSTQGKLTKPILERLVAELEEGRPARSMNLDADEIELISDLHLITLKKCAHLS